MDRVKIQLPEKVHFTTELSLRITDLNYGNHMANDKVLSLCHEARVQFLASIQCDEFNVFGKGLIMSNAKLQFISEGKYGMQFQIDLSVSGLSKVGFDLYYNIKASEKQIAMAKTGMLFYDYTNQKIDRMPETFEKLYS